MILTLRKERIVPKALWILSTYIPKEWNWGPLWRPDGGENMCYSWCLWYAGEACRWFHRRSEAAVGWGKYNTATNSMLLRLYGVCEATSVRLSTMQIFDMLELSAFSFASKLHQFGNERGESDIISNSVTADTGLPTGRIIASEIRRIFCRIFFFVVLRFSGFSLNGVHTVLLVSDTGSTMYK